MHEDPLVHENSCIQTETASRRDAAASFGLRLQCTRCRSNMGGWKCLECAFQMQISDGIVCALPPDRTAYYARFIADYERIRAAEGRGSQNEEYYLGLPYLDATGRNSEQWKIRACGYEYLRKRLLKPEHKSRKILDLGAGNCWMSFRLTLAGDQAVAVDLLTNEEDGLSAASHYQRRLQAQLPRFQAELVRLPFQDGQFDVVVFNASFHYSEDYEASLREALRCLKRGGIVIVSDTPWYSRDESGSQMVMERHATFRQRFGTASDSVKSLEYLTDERLRTLEQKLSIRWTIHSPWYGWKWAMRPWIAKLWRRREPSRFRIYVARKDA